MMKGSKSVPSSNSSVSLSHIPTNKNAPQPSTYHSAQCPLLKRMGVSLESLPVVERFGQARTSGCWLSLLSWTMLILFFSTTSLMEVVLQFDFCLDELLIHVQVPQLSVLLRRRRPNHPDAHRQFSEPLNRSLCLRATNVVCRSRCFDSSSWC